MFAQNANSFHAWLTDTRTVLMDGRGTLEEQLEAVKVSLFHYHTIVMNIHVDTHHVNTLLS